MHCSNVIILLLIDIYAAADRPAEHQNHQHKALQLQYGEEMVPTATATSRAAAAMAKHFMHVDLLATQRARLSSKSVAAKVQVHTKKSMNLLCVMAITFLVAFAIVFFAVTCGRKAFDSGSKSPGLPDSKSSGQPVTGLGYKSSAELHAPRPHSPGYVTREPAAPMGMGMTLPTRQVPSNFAPPLRTSPGATATSPYRMQSQASPTAASSAPQQTPSIWSSGAQQSLPPLCRMHAPTTSRTTLKMDTNALKILSERKVVEVMGGFGYPVAYARIGTGPEGSRLEVASEPSWNNVDVTVGPLPAGWESMIHGPDRELYGPFQRAGAGFTVGHYSRSSSVLMVTPKRIGNSVAVEVSLAGGQAVATFNGASFQIQLEPGIDVFLIIACVLATLVSGLS